MAARQQIPYGIVDFKLIRDEGYYYVDKTAYIRKMEARDSFVFFVRPRRMGKSLFVDTLRCYYDVNEKANFSRLFGDLDIGLNPTENANRYLVLTLDFSQVEFMAGETLEEKFSRYLASRMAGFVEKYRAFLPGLPAAFPITRWRSCVNSRLKRTACRTRSLCLRISCAHSAGATSPLPLKSSSAALKRKSPT